MPRYNPYGNRLQQPEQYDTGEVPYISYQSENTNPMLMQGMQQMQQRYDLAQTAIGKYLEENAAGKFRDADYENVVNSLNKKLEDIKTNVKDKYQGDYGAAANDVIQQLGKARSTFHQAEQAYAEEQKYLPIYQKLKSEGKLVTPKGYDPFQQSSFDEETGKFKDIDYSQMYERNDYNKWVQENISNRLNQHVDDDITGVINRASDSKNAFLIMTKTKGYRPEDIAGEVTKDDVEMFIQQNPTYRMEFSDANGNIDMNAAKDFITNTAKNQVYHQIDRSLTANPYWKGKEGDSNGGDSGDGPLDISSDVIHNPWNYNRFRSNNKNVSSGTYVMGIGDAGKFDPIPKVYNSKTHNLEQYQAKIIEKRILNSSSTGVDKNGNPVTAYKYPELRNLYDLAEYVNSPNFEVEVVDGKVLPKLPREAKFNNNGISIGGVSTVLGVNFLGAAAKWGVDGAVTAAGLTAIPLTTLGFKGDTRVDSQKMANQVKQAFIKQVNSEYQSKLNSVSKEYFTENPTDFGVREYSPNIMDSKTRTNYSQFLGMFDKVFKPSNFEFQEGDYISKSGEDIDKKYGGSDSKKVTFNPTAVSGNSETGLLFKVNQADGKMVNAKLKTSYHVQDEYLSKIMGIPSGTSHELRDALNGSAVSIDDKTGKISSVYSDMPLRNSYNFKAGVYDGTDIDDDAPRRVLLKENNEPITIEDIMAISKPEAIGKLENFYKGIYGNSYSINKPALMDKAMMFNILKSI